MDIHTSLLQALNDTTRTRASTTEAEKAELVEACSKVVSEFQSFEARLMDMLLAPLRVIVLRLAIDMRIFDASLGKESVTLEELSRETGCEALLIKRLMRVLISLSLFTEPSKGVFNPTPAAAVYSTDSLMAQVIISWTITMPTIAKLPEYFALKGYTSPTDSTDCPFQYAMGTKLHNFAWTASNPKAQQAVNALMTIRTKRSVDTKWFEVYPVARCIDAAAEEKAVDESVFLVDVGGGIGHQTIDFKEHFPDTRGKLVVQDTAAVIDTIESLPHGIEAAVHDFFTAQPIYGAKLYLLAHVLHDWPDKEAAVILGHVRDAMAPDSTVLLSETIMPEQNASLMAAGMDLNMMAAFASLERTEEQFRRLLEGVGLEVLGVWREEVRGSMLGQAVIEAKVKQG